MGELTAQYERLRQDALHPVPGRTPTPGMVLFLGHGMPAWMKTAAALLPARKAPIPAPRAGEETGSTNLRVQLAVLIAGIILGQHVLTTEEVHP